MPSQAKPLTMHLAGPRGEADLSDFANAVVALRNSLRNVWRCATGDEDMHCDVAELSRGSANVGVGISEGYAAVGVAVLGLYDATVHAIETGSEIDPSIDYATIYAFNGFASLARKDGVTLSIGSTKLTERFSERVASLLLPDSSSHGSVTGRLESVSIHGDTKFTLYPPVQGERVECVFRESDLSSVVGALGNTVCVYGSLHYAKSKAFPVRVDVDSFDVLPDDDSLPTLLGACGLLRLDSSSVDLIREMRDEWQ
jgi:hypothetical protein